jgi:hypothetical protein
MHIGSCGHASRAAPTCTRARTKRTVTRCRPQLTARPARVRRLSDTNAAAVQAHAVTLAASASCLVAHSTGADKLACVWSQQTASACKSTTPRASKGSRPIVPRQCQRPPALLRGRRRCRRVVRCRHVPESCDGKRKGRREGRTYSQWSVALKTAQRIASRALLALSSQYVSCRHILHDAG